MSATTASQAPPRGRRAGAAAGAAAAAPSSAGAGARAPVSYVSLPSSSLPHLLDLFGIRLVPCSFLLDTDSITPSSILPTYLASFCF